MIKSNLYVGLDSRITQTTGQNNISYSIKPMNLDNHIQGDFNYYNPATQSEASENIIESVSEALMIHDEDRALEILHEVFREVNSLRDYAENNQNIYLLKRLNSIYFKL